MGTNDVKLLASTTSPFAMRARLALNIKSVGYEYLEEQFFPKSELLLKSNPVYQTIPVLFHGDKIICESLIVVQYIDEFWSSGPQILPSDPYDRAIAHFWVGYIDHKWFPSIRDVIATQSGSEERKAAIQKLCESFELLEDAFKKCSKGKMFFGGDKIGYVDIALGCLLPWMKALEKLSIVNLLDVVIAPGLHKWAEDFCADSVVKDVMPETNEFVEFVSKVVIPRMRAPTQN